MNVSSPKNNPGSGSCRLFSSPKSNDTFGGPPPQPSPAQPVAYQRGQVNFYGRDFIVSPDVLIPRPETEQMIDLALDLVGKPYLPGVIPSNAKLPKMIKILDVGTGSGCVAITLKLEIPEATVVASDISEKALKIADKNAKNLKANVLLKKSDLLENIDFLPDLLVANLPYVDRDWDWIDLKSLSSEPDIALFAGDHGLALIKKLIDQAAKRKIPNIILEADPSQHQEIIKYAYKNNYQLKDTRGFILSFLR